MPKPHFVKSTLLREILLSAVITLAIMGSCLLGLITISRIRNFVYQRSKIGSIPLETVNDLCTKLSINEEQICQNVVVVYPTDFEPAIYEMFDRENTTYIEVQLILGNYQVKLDPLEWESRGDPIHGVPIKEYPFFASRYDLNGDGISDFSFFFDGTYENNNLFNFYGTYGIGF